MAKFLLYKIGQFLVNRLPLGAAYGFATFVSDLQYLCSFRDRRLVRANLRAVLGESTPDREIERLTREVFRNFGRYLVEFFRMANEIDDDFVRDRVRVNGREHIDAALVRGRGVILVTAHLGNWELGGVILSRLGYDLTVIALPHRERPVNNLFNRQREVHGLTVIPIQHAVRASLETLRHNKVVAIVADRDFTVNGEVMEFFGRRAMLPKGAAIFAYKTGAAIVPTFLVREDNNTFTTFVGEPVIPPRIEPDGQIGSEDLQEMIRTYKGRFEELIRRYPSQWLMFRRFWL